MFKVCLKTIFLFICFSVFTTNAFAVTGTYSGTLSGSETQISPPAGPFPISSDFAIAISELTFGGSIVGTGQITSGDFVGSIFSLSGTVSSGGVVTATFNAPQAAGNVISNGNGTIGGTINTSTFVWNISIFVTEANSTESYSGTLNFTNSAVAIDPSITPSSTVTEVILFNIQIQTLVTDISRHITGAVGGGHRFFGPRFSDNEFIIEGATGLNAGGGLAIPYGVWGSYSYTDFDNDFRSTAFDGTSHSFLGGIDFGFWDNTVLGVAFGYDDGDIDTTFNLGNQETDSYTIAPYFGALLTDSLSLDFTVGYSKVDYDQFRRVAGSTTRITSSPDADRWFSALNLNTVTYYDKWILGGRIGALYARSTIDSYTESNGAVVADSHTKLGSLSIAGDVAYSYQNYEPFVNLSYQNDFSLRKLTIITGPPTIQ